MSSTALARPSPASSHITAPSTPARQTSAPQATPQKEQQQGTPGTWRHPKIDEINRRKNSSTFTRENMDTILLNLLALVTLLIAPSVLTKSTPSAILALLASLQPYTNYALFLVRCIPVVNMLLAAIPLIRPVDDMNDIALSAEQRKLLGLKPQDAPLAEGAQYITPPRYSRSSTPRSSAKRPTSNSPLSLRGQSPSSLDRSSFGQSNPFSVSPLMQKAVGGASASRSSPLDASTGLASGKASVSLNSKWLYERGKASPSGRSVFG